MTDWYSKISYMGKTGNRGGDNPNRNPYIEGKTFSITKNLLSETKRFKVEDNIGFQKNYPNPEKEVVATLGRKSILFTPPYIYYNYNGAIPKMLTAPKVLPYDVWSEEHGLSVTDNYIFRIKFNLPNTDVHILDRYTRKLIKTISYNATFLDDWFFPFAASYSPPHLYLYGDTRATFSTFSEIHGVIRKPNGEFVPLDSMGWGANGNVAYAKGNVYFMSHGSPATIYVYSRTGVFAKTITINIRSINSLRWTCDGYYFYMIGLMGYGVLTYVRVYKYTMDGQFAGYVQNNWWTYSWENDWYPTTDSEGNYGRIYPYFITACEGSVYVVGETTNGTPTLYNIPFSSPMCHRAYQALDSSGLPVGFKSGFWACQIKGKKSGGL